MSLGWIQRAWPRRLFFLALVSIFAVLCVFPRQYLANVKLAPQETNTGGLATILNQLGGNFAALLGTHQPVEVDLTVARSHAVQGEVVKRLKLAGRPGFGDAGAAELKIRHMVDVRIVRGGVMEIRVEAADPDFALNVVTTYAAVMRDRLAVLSREQTFYKRGILTERLDDATTRLQDAQAAMAAYRAANGLPEAASQFSSAVSRLASLQGTLQARQEELAALLRFETPQNVDVQRLQSQIGEIQAQISAAKGDSSAGGAPSAQTLANKSVEYLNLYRKVQFTQALYDAYSRYMEGVAIEDLAADVNMQIIEPPYIDPALQFNMWSVALLLVAALAAVCAEFYVLNPPVGARRSVEAAA